MLQILVVLLAAMAQAELFGPQVISLNDANFKAETNKHSYMLIFFYAEWCPHCKGIAPQFARAAANMRRLTPQVVFGSVDVGYAKTNPNLKKKFKIRGFPTLMWMEQGKLVKWYDESLSSSKVMQRWVWARLPAQMKSDKNN